MTIIDSQFNIIDSLSEMFHWHEMLNWSLRGCKSAILKIKFSFFKYKTYVVGTQNTC